MLVGQIHKIRHDHSQAVIKKKLGGSWTNAVLPACCKNSWYF